MNKYKYFFKSDLNKEKIGVVKAKNEDEAYLKAANKKNLLLHHFKQIFKINKINNERKN